MDAMGRKQVILSNLEELNDGILHDLFCRMPWRMNLSMRAFIQRKVDDPNAERDAEGGITEEEHMEAWERFSFYRRDSRAANRRVSQELKRRQEALDAQRI